MHIDTQKLDNYRKNVVRDCREIITSKFDSPYFSMWLEHYAECNIGVDIYIDNFKDEFGEIPEGMSNNLYYSGMNLIYSILALTKISNFTLDKILTFCELIINKQFNENEFSNNIAQVYNTDNDPSDSES